MVVRARGGRHDLAKVRIHKLKDCENAAMGRMGIGRRRVDTLRRYHRGEPGGI
jgi:hypothetical protein